MLYRPGLLGRLPCPMDWYPGSGPPTISDDLTTSLAGWTFARASSNATNCLYTDTANAPAFTTYPTNTPRFLDFGLLIEPGRTNLFLNSEAPVSQTITLAVGAYAVWMHGASGSSVSVSQGTAVITGGNFAINVSAPPTSNASVFYVTTAGTATFLCGGTVTRVQVEAGNSPTSYIPTTGVVATRADDRLSKNYFGGQINPNEGTYWVEFLYGWTQLPDALKSEFAQRLLTIGNGAYTSNNNTEQLTLIGISGANNSLQYQAFNNAGSSQPGSISMQLPKALGAVCRVAASVSQTKNAIAADYSFGGKTASTFRPSSPLVVTLGGGGGGGSGGNHVPINGYIRGFKYWPVAMPDAELKECTAPGYYGGPAVFDYSFMGGPTAFPRRWLHTRGAATGVATDSVWDDAPGSTYNTYASNTPKMMPRGLLMDGSHSNYVPNSGTPPVGTVTSGNLGVQTYCVWMIGTGSVTVAPGTGAGTGFGTATQGNPIWLAMTTAGNVVLTINGSVNRLQIEQQGGNPPGAVLPRTFVQVTTAGQTNGGESATIPAANWFNNEQGTYVFEFSMLGYTSTWFLFSVWSGSDNQNREQIFNIIPSPAVAPTMNFRGNTIGGNVNLGGVDTPPVVGGVDLIPSRVHRVALSVGPARRAIVLNGQIKQDFPPGINNIVAPRPAYPTLFGIGTDATNATGVPRGNGYYRRVRYYDYAMTDDQLIALTGSASLDLSFMSGTLDSRITFTRASVATYFDATGALQTIGSGLPRFDYDPVTHAPLGLMIEETRTNLILNSAAPGTQSVAVTAQTYTLSFYGTGTITLSGVAVGTFVGTGPFPQRSTLVLSPIAGTLTMTMSGSVQNAQLEVGAYATSYIPTTAAAVTRAGEVAAIQTAGATWYAPGVGSLVVEGSRNTTPGTVNLWWAGIGTNVTAANEVGIFCSGTQALGAQAQIRSASANIYNKSVSGGAYNNSGVPSKTGMTWQAGLLSWSINGIMRASAEAVTGPIPTLNQLTIGCRASGLGQINGYIRRLRYWDRPITDTELVTATT